MSVQHLRGLFTVCETIMQHLHSLFTVYAPLSRHPANLAGIPDAPPAGAGRSRPRKKKPGVLRSRPGPIMKKSLLHPLLMSREGVLVYAL